MVDSILLSGKSDQSNVSEASTAASIAAFTSTDSLRSTASFDDVWDTPLTDVALGSQDDDSSVRHQTRVAVVGLNSIVLSESVDEYLLPGVPFDSGDSDKSCQHASLRKRLSSRNADESCQMVIHTPSSPRIKFPWKMLGRTHSSSSSKTCISPQSSSSVKSCASQKFQHPEETLILLDWDDTLCPTSSCLDLLGGVACADSIDTNRTALLVAHENTIVALLQDAVMLGGVTIVTMAEPHWVEHCIDTLMPEVGKTLKQLRIEVIGARCTGKSKLQREASGDCRSPAQYLKTKAITRIAKRFYRRRGTLRGALGGQRSWKNIISVGDSDAELLALQDVVFHHKQYDKKGNSRACHCKTVRFLREPNLEDLTLEINTVREILSELVLHDGDASLNMGGPSSVKSQWG